MNAIKTLKAYLAVFNMRFRMEMQYRGAVVGGFICQIVFGLILIAIYRALYAGSPQGMSLASITSYVWLQQSFFRMLLSQDSDLAEKIRSGAIAYDLCRPINLYTYYFSRILAQKWMGSLLRVIPMIILALILPSGWNLSAPASFTALLLAIAALLFGLICVCALENITMAFTMRTMDHRGVQAILNMLMMTFSGNILPLTLFPDSWQKVIALLPYAQLLDAPIRLYTGEYAISESGRILLTQALWSLALILLGYCLWQRNQKKIVIQGG